MNKIDTVSPGVDYFSVGVAMRAGLRGGGTLAVSPGRLYCRIGRLSSSLSGIASVTHSGTVIDVYTARLIPPWMNVSCVVMDDDNTILVSLPIISRKRLLTALRANGFEVRTHRTWVFRGRHLKDIVFN